jgi:hypothetical protein
MHWNKECDKMRWEESALFGMRRWAERYELVLKITGCICRARVSMPHTSSVCGFSNKDRYQGAKGRKDAITCEGRKHAITCESKGTRLNNKS